MSTANAPANVQSVRRTMNGVRDLPLGVKEQDSLKEEAGLTATVTGAPQFVTGNRP